MQIESITPPPRLCRSCGEEKPLSAYYPRSDRYRGRPRSSCKQCCDKAKRLRGTARRKATAICVVCHRPFHPSYSRPNAQHCSPQCLGMSRRRPASERFWSHIDKDGPIQPHTPELGPCWPWTAWRLPKGYGSFTPKKGSGGVLAHRFSWELSNGPIPDGLSVLHRCDNPPCVRPKHLFLGTDADNVRDMMDKGRHWAQQHPEDYPRGDKHWSRLHPERVVRGERNGSAKLCAADVLEIRAMHAVGLSGSAIARLIGMAPSSILRILSGANWA